MSTCRTFLTAMRETVCPEARAVEAKASVSGEDGRYTINFSDGRYHDANEHCKYCARVAFLEAMDGELGPTNATGGAE